MSQSFHVRKNKKSPVINITPLIDVMFLLLIFFMVSSTFRDTYGIDVDLPEAGSATEQETGVHELVVTADGEYYIGEEMIPRETLEQAVQQLLDEDPDARLVLRADEKTAFGAFIHAVDIARKVGGSRLYIPTRYPDQVEPSFTP